VVTPNIPEAERLTGLKISSIDDAREAARKIVKEYHANAAVVKGGHLAGEESIDVLYHKEEFKEFKWHRIKTKHTHGTGCVFSAAIAAELAKGNDIAKAIESAKKFVVLCDRVCSANRKRKWTSQSNILDPHSRRENACYRIGQGRCQDA